MLIAPPSLDAKETFQFHALPPSLTKGQLPFKLGVKN